MFVLPLPAEEVTRNADPHGLLEGGGAGGGAHPQRTRDQALERKTKEGKEEKDVGEKQLRRDHSTKERSVQTLFSFIVSNIKTKIYMNKNNRSREEEPERPSFILR